MVEDVKIFLQWIAPAFDAAVYFCEWATLIGCIAMLFILVPYMIYEYAKLTNE